MNRAISWFAENRVAANLLMAAILIGGLKNITTIDRQSQSPFLAKLPLLSFLFSRKGRSDEISNLMILVRAEITDLAEQEERLMGGR